MQYIIYQHLKWVKGQQTLFQKYGDIPSNHFLVSVANILSKSVCVCLTFLV